MIRQWSAMSVVASAIGCLLTAVSAAHFRSPVSLASTKVKNVVSPEMFWGVMTKLEASSRAAGATPEPPAEFVSDCLALTREIVYVNVGSKDSVEENMRVVCSKPKFAPDTSLCGDYTENLLGHMHEDDWNMKAMDYGLFCKGFSKTVQAHMATAVSLAATRMKNVVSPEMFWGVMTKLEASSRAAGATPEPPVEFVTDCLALTREIVYVNEGSKDSVEENMRVVCSKPKFAPDTSLCGDYTENLLGHMHEDDWNMKAMDYGLFCKGFSKTVQAHMATAVSLASTRMKNVVSPEMFWGVMTKLEASSRAAGATPEPPAEFVSDCLDLTREIVYVNEGSKDSVEENMRVVCSKPKFAPDTSLCGDYTENLLGHMHEDDWNMKAMDYGLFCKGFSKTVQAHMALPA